MMKKLLLGGMALFLLLGTTVFLFFSDELVSWRNRGTGYLTVISKPVGLPVTFGDQTIGETPLEKVEVSAGESWLRIGDTWRDKINVMAGQEIRVSRSVYATEGFGFGSVLSYESSSSLFGSAGKLLIVSDPPRATVEFEGKQVGETPLFLEDLTAQDYEIKVRKAGYATQEIRLTVKSNLIARLEVDLRPALLEQREKLDLSGVELPEATSVNLVGRLDWGGVTPKFTPSELGEVSTPWSQIEVWGVQVGEIRDFDKFILGFDNYVQEEEGLLALPFAFLVNDQGKVYEGFGVFDYDFSRLAGYNYQPGVAPVLLVSSDGEYFNDEVKQALAGLRDKLSDLPTIRARKIADLSPIEAQLGEVRELKMSYQNMSSLIWHSQGANEVVLIAQTDADRSELYHPSSWRSPKEVGSFKGSEVIPGGTVDFDFAIQVPYYPGEFSETFVLKDKERDQVIPDSEFTVTLRVEGAVEGVLQIAQTPTGFLNVRSGPGTNFALLTTIYPGEKYAWVAQNGKWYQILMRDGSKGWISGDYISRIE